MSVVATTEASPAGRTDRPYVLGVALGLLLVGLLVRYLAHLAAGGGPSLEAYADAMADMFCAYLERLERS